MTAVAIALACAARASSGASVTSPARLASSWSRVGCAVAQCGPTISGGVAGFVRAGTSSVTTHCPWACSTTMRSSHAFFFRPAAPNSASPPNTATAAPSAKPQRQGALLRIHPGQRMPRRTRSRTRSTSRSGRRWSASGCHSATASRYRSAWGSRWAWGSRTSWASRTRWAWATPPASWRWRPRDSRAGWRWRPGRASSTEWATPWALRWWAPQSWVPRVGASVGFSLGDLVGSVVAVAVGRDGLGRSLGRLSEGVGRSKDPDGSAVGRVTSPPDPQPARAVRSRSAAAVAAWRRGEGTAGLLPLWGPSRLRAYRQAAGSRAQSRESLPRRHEAARRRTTTARTQWAVRVPDGPSHGVSDGT